jgi:autotransporter translocation and assembly factor TamB
LSAARNIAKALRRGLLAAGLLAATALAVLYAFTFTDRFREFARREVQEAVRGSFHGEITVERLDGSIWGDLRLGNVLLRYSGTDVLKVPEARIRYDLLPLLRGELRITDLDLEGPVVDLRRDAAGVWNLEAALSTPPGDAASSTLGVPHIVIDALRVAAGRISVTPCRAEAPCVLDDAALGARVVVEATGTDADIQRLSFRLAAEGLPLVWADGALHYRGTASPPSAEVHGLAVVTQESRVTVDGKIENPIDLRTARSDLVLNVAGLGPSDVATLSHGQAPADWLGGSVRLAGRADDLHAHFDLAVGQGHLQGDVRADALATPIAAEGTVEASDIELARIPSAAGAGGVASGQLEGAVRGTDVLQARAKGQVQVRDASFRQWHLGDLASTVSLADGRATAVGTLEGTSGTARWNGTADLGGAQAFQLGASITHFDPKRLDPRGWNGDVTLDARAEGQGFDLAQQRSRVVVELAPSKIESLAFDRGRGDVRLEGGRLYVTELSLESRDSQIRAAGDLGLSTDAKGQATVQAKIGDVAPFLVLAGIEGRGSLTLHGDLRGTANDLATSGFLDAASFGSDRAWIEHGSARFDLKGLGGQAPKGRVDVSVGGVHSAMSLESLSAQVSLSGAADKIATDASVQAKDIDGRRYTTTFRATRDPGGIEVGVAALHLDAPSGNFDLERPAHFSLRSGVLTVDEMRISGAKGTLTASGSVSRSGPQRLELVMHGVPLEWVRAFRPDIFELAGNLDVAVHVGGTAASPQVDATLSVTELRVAGRPYTGLHATLAFRAPVATLEARFDQDASHALLASGRAPMDLRWDPELVHRISGDIALAVRSNGLDVGFVSTLMPGTLRDVKGEVVVDLEAHGPLDRLVPRGTIALRGGRATITPLGIDVNAATLALAVAPDAIRVTELSAVAREGRLVGGGTISMDDYVPDRLDLRIALDRWPAIATNRYRSDISAEIFCRGTVTAPQITGTVTVLSGSFNPDLAFLTRAPTTRDPTIRIVSADATTPDKAATAEAPAGAPSALPSFYKNAALDVTITIRRDTWIRHANAAVELVGEVVARKQPPGDLQLTGRIETVRGWMNLQGRRFRITEGTLAFTGGDKIDPALNLTADYRAGEYLVQIILGGTASSPSLTLASEPPLQQADILSVLIFGKTTADLSDRQRADVQSQASQLAASFAASEIGQSVTDILGLSGRGIWLQELSASRVALGAYLSDKTFVTAGRSFGDQQGQEIRVQRVLTPSWSISSSASSIGGSGADIIWRHRY